MFDEILEQRLEILPQTDLAGQTVISFVRRELEQVDVPESSRTDDVLGTFASHLFAALCRSLRGDGLTEFSADDSIDEAIAEQPAALHLAQALARRAQDELGVALPNTEIRILALHFASLLAQYT